MGLDDYPCWAADLFEDGCEGRIDPAHIGFTRQGLKRHGIDGADLWDRRIIRPVCRRHHQELDGPYFHLSVEQMPDSVLEFAEERGLRHLLDKADLRHRQTAAHQGSCDDREY